MHTSWKGNYITITITDCFESSSLFSTNHLQIFTWIVKGININHCELYRIIFQIRYNEISLIHFQVPVVVFLQVNIYIYIVVFVKIPNPSYQMSIGGSYNIHTIGPQLAAKIVLNIEQIINYKTIMYIYAHRSTDRIQKSSTRKEK